MTIRGNCSEFSRSTENTFSFAILAEVYNRMSRAHAYSTAPILMTFTTCIHLGIRKSKISFSLHITNTIGWNGHVYIWVSQLVFSTVIEEMDVSALKAHPLHDKRGYDILKNYFCVYIFTL